MSGDVEAALVRLAREDSGRVLAVLTRRLDDLHLADDAVQEALIEAAATWPQRGIPDNPAGWLMTVARRKAIDSLRRADSAHRRTIAAAAILTAAPDETNPGPELISDNRLIADDQLRLVLLCAHPALDVDAQVALTLRLVGGLTVDEIAAAFLVPPPTMAQRIVRAKRKIRDARIPLSIPADLSARAAGLLRVLYLVFNEGYLSRGDRPEGVRLDLMDEAVRLTALASELIPDEPELAGLLALELFHRARYESRLDASGDLILLADQDRTIWDLALIERANSLLHKAMRQEQPGRYQVEATIAAYHANARTAVDTDWSTIAALYAQLHAMTGSDVVALNHAVAVAMADGPLAGLVLLNELGQSEAMSGFHLFHAARAELLMQAGDSAAAIDEFTSARALADNPAEQRHLDRRLAAARIGRT